MTTVTCTKCYKSLDQSLFINKKGENNEYTSKTDENVSILSYKELDQYLTEMINDIGQEEYLENCESGIEFSCFINISFLSNQISKEIADNIKNFIGEVDGYYYM